jgi:type VI secretion system secreted protein Hcp
MIARWSLLSALCLFVILALVPDAFAGIVPTDRSVAFVTFQGLATPATSGQTKSGQAAAIEIVSFSLPVSTPTQPASRQVKGQRQPQPVTIIKAVDSSSPALLRAVLNGQVFPQVTIDLFNKDASGKQSLRKRLVFTNVIITQDNPLTGANSAKYGNKPMESISFAYEKFQSSTGSPNPQTRIKIIVR